ncbi:MAG: stage III sporulation protein AC [Clostridia bacterium]|nr:stage III sporulation protein AC [Clostridia bacterium]
MDVTIVVKIAAVGIVVAVLNSILSRAGREDYAILTILAGIAAVLMLLLPRLTQLLDSVQALLDF